MHRAKQFRTARLDLRLSVQDCAKLLRVSVRTVGNWESGETGIPHAAYKLMRMMRGERSRICRAISIETSWLRYKAWVMVGMDAGDFFYESDSSDGPLSSC